MEPEVAEVIRRARGGVLDDPDSPDRWAALGAAFLAHELHSEAATAYTAAGALADDDYRFPYLKARSLWRADPELAEAAALEAIGLNPGYAPAYLLAGQIAEDRADPEAARDHYRAALDRLGTTRSAPANTAAASFRLGRLLASDGNLEASHCRFWNRRKPSLRSPAPSPPRWPACTGGRVTASGRERRRNAPAVSTTTS